MKRYEMVYGGKPYYESAHGDFVKYRDMDKLLTHIANYLERMAATGLDDSNEARVDALLEAIHVARGGTFIQGG